MRTYAWPLLATLALTINACGSDGQQATDGGRDGGDASGRGGTTGRGGAGGATGGSTAGTGGGTAGTGGSTAGAGGASAGAGGSTAGTGAGTAGTGGGTAGRGGSGGSAGSGGSTAGTGGGTAGRGGSGGSAGSGGSTAGTGGGTAGRGGTGGTAGTGGGTAGRGGTGGTAGTGGLTAGTGGGSAGRGGTGGTAGAGGSTAGTGGSTAGAGGSTAGTGGTGGTAGGGGTVACSSPGTCPGGADTECQQKTCLGGFCGLSFTAANTPVTAQTAGDCHRNVCDGIGNVMAAILDSDPPANDGNACTAETCVNGLPSHPAEPARTPCAQGGGTLCNGSQAAPACVVCLAATDCSGVDTICHQRVCGNQNTCGFSNAAAGTAAEPDATGNCQKAVCDSTGGVTSANDNTDVPADDGNSCTDDVCANGVPSHPAKQQGTACTGPNGGAVCSGTNCVQCLTAATCPGTDTICSQRTCLGNGMCSHTFATAGTAAEPDATGNCKKAVCDGAGAIMAAIDNTDLPVDGNVCTSDVCTNGVASNPNLPPGTTCAADGSKACDATPACNTLTFRVVRVGVILGAGLTNAATAAFIEERRTDGSLVGTIALPVAANGAQQPLTVSGSATSEGALSLSSDGHYLALAGYAAAPGTAAVASGTANRVAGRISVAGDVDTTTSFVTGTAGNNVRSAATTDGSEFWIGGAGGGTAGGIWYNTLAGSNERRIVSTPSNVRWVSVFGNQLYGSSGTIPFTNVFSIGFGTPTATGQTATSLPGMSTTGGSPYGFAMFDLSGGVAGLDTMYVADDAAGLQKWTFNGTTWSVASTINITGNVGFRGVAGYAVGGTVTLMASTAESTNRLVVFVDDGSGTVTGGVVATAAANTVYRGVAVSPHFAPP